MHLYFFTDDADASFVREEVFDGASLAAATIIFLLSLEGSI